MSFSCFRTIVGAALLGAALLVNLPTRADELAAIDPQARTGGVGWRVDGITGEASAHRGAGAAMRLAVGQVLSTGSEVETGAGAVVFLSHNGDRLIVQPNSRLRIDEPGTAGLLDHFLQSMGSVFYDVEPRKNRSFGVRAPYVAAIVKGTRFLVTVEPKKNSVRVDRGRVLVESTDGVSSVLVGAGNLATVDPALAPGVTLSASGIPDLAAATTIVPGSQELPASTGSTAAAGTSAVDAASNTVGTVTDAAGAVANAVGDATSSATGAVGNAVGGVTSTAGNVVGGVANTAGNVVGGVANAVGGAVGGLLGGKN